MPPFVMQHDITLLDLTAAEDSEILASPGREMMTNSSTASGFNAYHYLGVIPFTAYSKLCTLLSEEYGASSLGPRRSSSSRSPSAHCVPRSFSRVVDPRRLWSGENFLIKKIRFIPVPRTFHGSRGQWRVQLRQDRDKLCR